MIAITKKELRQFQLTRIRKLKLDDLTFLGYIVKDSMYRNNELVLVTTDPEQDCVYKDLAPEQRSKVIQYYQEYYYNVSQYKNLSKSKYRYLTMLDKPIDLSEPKLVEVRLPC